MAESSRLLERLIEAGFSESLVRASLPTWWSPEEEQSSSGQTLVALLLARRLSLDPESLLDDNVPVGFLHTGPTKFKHLRLKAGKQRDALTAYCQGVARIVFTATKTDDAPVELPTAAELRAASLASGRDHVGFGDVLTLCWSLAIPVLHLRLFPAATKGISAMSVRLGQRYAILVARESGVAAQYMFHVAHELGHICLGHLKKTVAIIDAESPDSYSHTPADAVDDEEVAADQFAQELLTGAKLFSVDRASLDGRSGNTGTARELAKRALQVGHSLGVDPGHIVMCYAETTGEWALAQSAAKRLPHQEEKPATLVNKVFWDQIGTVMDEQSAPFLQAIASV